MATTVAKGTMMASASHSTPTCERFDAFIRCSDISVPKVAPSLSPGPDAYPGASISRTNCICRTTAAQATIMVVPCRMCCNQHCLTAACIVGI